MFESQETCSSFPQEHGDISKCATQGDSNQACILAVGTIIGGIKAAHIVLEKKVLLWVTKLTDMMSFLFSMFFLFINLSYMSGTNSFHQFLECVFMYFCNNF